MSSTSNRARRPHPRTGLWACLGIAVVLASCGLVLAARSAPAQEGYTYSPYADPQKPTLSTVLSSDADLADFRERFALTAADAERMLTALSKESKILAEEHAESDDLLKTSRSLERDTIARKVAASDYDERVAAAVAETKRVTEDVVGEDSVGELRDWVDGRFAADRAALYAEAVQPAPEPSIAADSTSDALASRARGLSCRVWASYYRGYTRYEVALPHQYLKFKGGVRVGIRNARGDNASGPVKEVGPWNVRDNYWQKPKNRSQWKNLPRCVPEAAAAYYNNYNRGKDGFGREVLNPAGFDITPAVARSLGVRKQIERYGKVRVSVYFPWVRR